MNLRTLHADSGPEHLRAAASVVPAGRAAPEHAGRSSMAPRSTEFLHACLDRIQTVPPEYGQGLSSHLPMAVHALFQLGANEAQMETFMAGYLPRFRGRRLALQGHVLPDWRQALGQFEAFEDVRSSFVAALARAGRDAVLGEALPALLPGVSAAAFHGLIRTAHAVESAHEAELASALAYWACRWQGLAAPPQSSSQGPGIDLATWSAALVDGARGWRSDAPLIFLRMQEASATPLYAQLAQALKPEPKLAPRLAQLAHLALGYYLDSGNFTVLHMITGLRALRVLLPWVPERLQADPAVQDLLGQAFVAAYLAGRVQARPRSGSDDASSLSGAELAAAACRSTDDHVIKLVHACGDEMAAYAEPRYKMAAAWVLGQGRA